jgi:hypothetical protein
MTRISIEIVESDGRHTPESVEIRQVLLAGYTGRDQNKVLQHIHELEALGVAPPERIPMIYVVEPDLLTMDHRLTVHNDQTSGEAEFYLLRVEDTWLIGVGSDHTDRQHEAIDVAESKALCPKAISPQVWRYDDIRDHWDSIEIRSWVTDGAGRRLYQEGRLDTFMTIDNLLAELSQAGYSDFEGRLIFGGTLPTLGEFVFGQCFETELRDRVLGRRLARGYDIVVIA